MKVSFKKIRDLEVITDYGFRIGVLKDAVFDEKDGTVFVFLVKPYKEVDTSLYVTSEEGYILIPTNATISIGDVVVVDGKRILKSNIKNVKMLQGNY